MMNRNTFGKIPIIAGIMSKKGKIQMSVREWKIVRAAGSRDEMANQIQPIIVLVDKRKSEYYFGKLQDQKNILRRLLNRMLCCWTSLV